jgi:hypothetical protein
MPPGIYRCIAGTPPGSSFTGMFPNTLPPFGVGVVLLVDW